MEQRTVIHQLSANISDLKDLQDLHDLHDFLPSSIPLKNHIVSGKIFVVKR